MKSAAYQRALDRARRMAQKSGRAVILFSHHWVTPSGKRQAIYKPLHDDDPETPAYAETCTVVAVIEP